LGAWESFNVGKEGAANSHEGGLDKINFCDIKLLSHQPFYGHRGKTPELESRPPRHNTGMKGTLKNGSPIDDDLLDESKIYADGMLLKRDKHRKSLVECRFVARSNTQW